MLMSIGECTLVSLLHCKVFDFFNVLQFMSAHFTNVQSFPENRGFGRDGKVASSTQVEGRDCKVASAQLEGRNFTVAS